MIDGSWIVTVLVFVAIGGAGLAALGSVFYGGLRAMRGKD